jgi:hypothetical protein
MWICGFINDGLSKYDFFTTVSFLMFQYFSALFRSGLGLPFSRRKNEHDDADHCGGGKSDRCYN